MDLYIVHPQDVRMFRKKYKYDLIWSGEEWDCVRGCKINNVYIYFKPFECDEFINNIVLPCMFGGKGKIYDRRNLESN